MSFFYQHQHQHQVNMQMQSCAKGRMMLLRGRGLWRVGLPDRRRRAYAGSFTLLRCRMRFMWDLGLAFVGSGSGRSVTISCSVGLRRCGWGPGRIVHGACRVRAWLTVAMTVAPLPFLVRSIRFLPLVAQSINQVAREPHVLSVVLGRSYLGVVFHVRDWPSPSLIASNAALNRRLAVATIPGFPGRP